MSKSLKSKKERILLAGEKAVDELIKVLEQSIIIHGEDADLAADKMKNAAAAKRLAFEDALVITERIEKERDLIDEIEMPEVKLGNKGFAEGRAHIKK